MYEKSSDKDEMQVDKDTGDDSEADMPEKELLAKILEKMKPKETVTKTLQRLGNASTSAKIPEWKLKRMEKLKQRKIKALGKTDIGKYMVEEEPGNAEDLKLLTSYVDILSRKGYYDIYTDSFEKIKYKLSTSGKSKKEDEFDMFGDKIISDEKAPADSLEDSETKWEYKVGNDGSITGPLLTEAMIKLKDANKGEIFCRRINSSSFYNINRVDFDLW